MDWVHVGGRPKSTKHKRMRMSLRETNVNDTRKKENENPKGMKVSIFCLN